MARKKRTSPAEDLIEIVAMLPWWLGVVLALVSYFFLHSIASTYVAPATGQPGQIGHLAVDTLKKSMAGIGQYLVPVVCLVGAAVSAVRRRARTQLIQNVIAATGSIGLKAMSWQEFEHVVGEGFRLNGYAITENGGGGPDGGIDLVLKKDGEKFLVQCKQWRALKVGVTVVRELYGVMAAGGAAGGFVVTCGRFTEEAKAFAKGRNVTLLDGVELELMIRRTRAESASSHTRQSTPVLQTSGTAAPDCPTCGVTMVERTVRRGVNAGMKFWGCTDYPSCEGTSPID